MATADTNLPTVSAEPVGLPEVLLRGHLPALDGLRAIAVLLVILYHFGVPGVPGGSGVTIFFVLSGFLITWLMLKEQDSTGTVKLIAFYRRRALRIFPAFYTYWVLLVVGLIVTARHVPWTHAAASALYLTDYYNAIYGDPNTGFSHTWSLAIEEQFYLLWPATFLWLRGAPRTTIRRLALLIVGIWLYRVLLVVWLNVDQGYLYAAFDTRVDALLVGCLLAIVLQSGRRTALLATAGSPWYALGNVALMVILHLGLLVGGTTYRDTVLHSVFPVLAGVLIVQVLINSSSSMWRWLDWGPVRFLGRVSYGLYLYQQVCVPVAQKLLSTWPVVMQLIGALALTILAAAVSFFLIERPFLRKKHALTVNPTPQST